MASRSGWVTRPKDSLHHVSSYYCSDRVCFSSTDSTWILSSVHQNDLASPNNKSQNCRVLKDGLHKICGFLGGTWGHPLLIGMIWDVRRFRISTTLGYDIASWSVEWGMGYCQFRLEHHFSERMAYQNLRFGDRRTMIQAPVSVISTRSYDNGLLNVDYLRLWSWLVIWGTCRRHARDYQTQSTSAYDSNLLQASIGL